MVSGRIDLHTHSRVSDGTDTPAELVAAAARSGLEVVALTDHDTTDGWAEALAAGEGSPVTVVPGLEISTHRPNGAGAHLLAYWPDPGHEPLQALLSRIVGGRRTRLPEMLERLRELGSAITIDDVRAASAKNAVIGRPHVADALVALGEVQDRDEAFSRYLSAGRPGYVDRFAPDLARTVSLIRDAGGVTVLAHPWGRVRSVAGRIGEDELRTLIAAGLSGIEVDHQDHDAEQRRELAGLADRLGLIPTGSSDYHGTGKIDHPLGVNTTSAESFERLRTAAATAAAAAAAGDGEADVVGVPGERP